MTDSVSNEFPFREKRVVYSVFLATHVAGIANDSLYALCFSVLLALLNYHVYRISISKI